MIVSVIGEGSISESVHLHYQENRPERQCPPVCLQPQALDHRMNLWNLFDLRTYYACYAL